MRTVAVLATVGAARAAAAPDRVAWGARRRAAPALEAEAVPLQDAPRAADDGAWWAAAKSGESAAELERMSSLLRRQLQDGAYSYLFTEGPSTMPSPQPSPMPSAMPVAQPTPATKSPTPDCGSDSLYTLTLTDTDGADGWGGETYTISSDSSTVETGTLSSGAEDAVQFCLEDGAYTLALSGAGTAVCSGACLQQIQWLIDNGVGKGDDQLQLTSPTLPKLTIAWSAPVQSDAAVAKLRKKERRLAVSAPLRPDGTTMAERHVRLRVLRGERGTRFAAARAAVAFVVHARRLGRV